ncbi:MAG: histone H1-beta, late embryonic [Hyphomicrobiales bacterium]|nr:histone H1-beta, late embryonic [Hyphomicrobiales bacterium]
MTSAPFIIETALLLLVTYVVGCVIGDLARRWSLAEWKLPAIGQPIPLTPQAQMPVVVPDVVPAEMAAAADPIVPPDLPPEPVEMPAPPIVETLVQSPESVAVTEPTPVPPRRKSVARAKATEPSAPEQPAEPEGDGRPQPLDSPRGGVKDNLKQIKGIGPKIESTLNALGVFHFDQIAAWDESTSAWVDGHLGFKGRIAREDWIAQAKARLAENATKESV